MNQETIKFVEDLKKDPNVTGIILFGSWARGNNRPESDVDLVVIVKEGYKRTVEYRDRQAFEIIYTTDKGAFDFWESHKDDAAGLWEVAKILYDANGSVAILEEKIRKVLKEGKKAIDDLQKGQLMFDAEDVLRYAEQVHSTDPTTANLLLANKVFCFTELFFDIGRLWTPAPKQRLAMITANNTEFYRLLVDFYSEESKFKRKLELARRMLPIIFNES